VTATIKNMSPHERCETINVIDSVFYIVGVSKDASRGAEAKLAAELRRMWRREYTAALKEIFETIPDEFTEDAAKFLEEELLSALGEPFGASKSAHELLRKYIADAHIDGKKEFVVKPLTSLPDRRAIEALTRHSCFWLGQHYGERVGPKISELTRNALDTGIGRKALAEDLKRELGGIAPKDYRYWDVVSSAALVRGRSFGFISGMAEAELEYYEVLAMMDERMCPICGEMNGRVFSVAETQKVINSALDLNDPKAFKEAMPWQTKPATDISNKKLCSSGQSVPPFHGRCRCTLIAAGSTVSKITPPIAEDQAGRNVNIPQSGSTPEEQVKALIAAGVKTDQDAIAIGELLYGNLLPYTKDADTLRKNILGELAKYRDFGGTPTFLKGSHSTARTFIEEAAKLYPADWINEINKNGGIYARGAVRGRHLYWQGRHEIAIDLRGTATAAHELGHALERYFSSKNIEKQFYNRRTSDEKLESLRTLYPKDGYKANEKTRKDQFAHAYMGKDYGGQTYEVYSMALEDIYFNTFDMWHKDPETIKFMLGTLLGVGK
jgi:hypothetical protein